MLDLPEEEPFILAMALSYIYTGGGDLEVVTQIWPRFKANYADMQEDHSLFLGTMVKLYKLGDRLMLQGLVEYASDSMFDHCECYEGWGEANGWDGSDQDHTTWDDHTGADCHHDGWEGCEYKTSAIKALKKRSSRLHDLIATLYEKLPDDQVLRARATVEALNVARKRFFVHPESHDGFDDAFMDLLKENDLVAWNVARHYRAQLEMQHKYHQAQLRSTNSLFGREFLAHCQRYNAWESEWAMVRDLDLDTIIKSQNAPRGGW